MLLTKMRQSCTSGNVIFDSPLVYLLLSRRYLSMADTMAERVAFSGLPPCSRKLELW